MRALCTDMAHMWLTMHAESVELFRTNDDHDANGGDLQFKAHNKNDHLQINTGPIRIEDAIEIFEFHCIKFSNP